MLSGDLTDAGIISRDIQKKYLGLLLYLHDFELLSIAQSMSEFDKCDKGSLAKSLWLSHRHETTGLRLICKLCIDFHINDAKQLLCQVLGILLHKKDVNFLIDTIHLLTSRPKLYNIGFGILFSKALFISFERRFSEKGADAVAAYRKNIKHLSSPAVIFDVESDKIRILFMDYMRSDDVVVLLDAFSGLVRLPGIIKTQPSEFFVDININLCGAILEEIRLPLWKDIHVVVQKIIFGMIDVMKRYELVIKHRESFAFFVVSNDRIDGVLDAALKRGAIEDAHRLISLYFSYRKLDTSSPEEQMTLYLESRSKGIKLWE